MRAAPDVPIRTCGHVLERCLGGAPAVLAVFEIPGCGPCQSLGPALETLAREFEGRVKVVRVTDADEGWLAARYHLAFVPTLLFCRDGQEVARIKGNPGYAAIRAHLEYALTGERPPEPAEGPRYTLMAHFGPVVPPEPRLPLALLSAHA